MSLNRSRLLYVIIIRSDSWIEGEDPGNCTVMTANVGTQNIFSLNSKVTRALKNEI